MTDPMQLLLLCCGSILVGGAFIYLLFLRRKPDTNVLEKTQQKVQQHADQRELVNAVSSTSSKKTAKSKKRREAQQEFSHSWMLGALKGHTGPLLQIDFSANGKFLASCAEAAINLSSASVQPRPPPSPTGSSRSSSSSDQEPRRPVLSRRQRKNRTRAPRREHDDGRPPPLPTKQHKSQLQRRRYRTGQDKIKQTMRSSKMTHSFITNGVLSNDPFFNPDPFGKFSPRPSGNPLDTFRPVVLQNKSDANLWFTLKKYQLTTTQMSDHGYPSILPGGNVKILYRVPPQGRRTICSQKPQVFTRRPLYPFTLDANAREFVPRKRHNLALDSGCGSGVSSTDNSDQDLESSSDGEIYYSTRDAVLQRSCSRCSRPFYVSSLNGDYVYSDGCQYHWGKFRGGMWMCCDAGERAPGCSRANVHVWTGVVEGDNGPYDDFIDTISVQRQDNNYGVYSMDCEMCFTKCGLEVGRVTLVDRNGVVVYDEIVEPNNPIIDYNTRFSGLRAEDFVNAKKLWEVRYELRQFISADTILIGHGLENDLRALRILHPTVIDTTHLFPHDNGLPYKNSLRYLTKKYLGVRVQQDEHNPVEDARSALYLVYYLWSQENNQIISRPIVRPKRPKCIVRVTCYV
ncbi:uncharacterized protein LOC131666782 isoform X2 [Phymastichus coffea]|uniref:uncharacterized protein LOC131666782 isoform X2 n=1 Tax=Phymastichus coffea TaxID=108790 RepID=UPI00273AFAAA|nr:uncharacterized protein LOC131666782 isoform X2 [Phymastichus coffea]